MIESLLLLAGGLLAGGLGGLLGLGGGIVLMPLLRFGVGLPPAEAAGTCALAVFFTTLGGGWRYHRQGLVSLRPLAPVLVAGVIAAVITSLLFPRLASRSHWLDLGVGLVFLLVASRMLLEGVRRRPAVRSTAQSTGPAGTAAGIPGPATAKVLIGTAAGALPGLLGIGTGGILVPAFTFLLRAPVKTAMGASLVCFCLNALISATFKSAQGFVDPRLALPICLGTLVGSGFGSTLNGRCSSRLLKTVFGLVFCHVAWRFLSSFLEAGS